MSLKKKSFFLFFLLFFTSVFSFAGFSKTLRLIKNPFSDLPLVQNYWVEQWISAFQGPYSNRFRRWLERSYRYTPVMKDIFKSQNLPEDLVYLCMIESGFSPQAVSPAKAVGYWQFIQPTALRFGLRKNRFLDERKDFEKSTFAARKYLKFLYKKFGTWVLAVAAYNMGENKLTQLIKKHQTSNFWILAQKSDFPYETAHYIPQLMAAIAIAKAPELFGFNHLKIKTPHRYEVFYLPGGTDLRALSKYIGCSYQTIKVLNPGLLTHFLPVYLEDWSVRIPKGSGLKVSSFIQSIKNTTPI